MDFYYSVYRDSVLRRLPHKELLVGDIFKIYPGMMIPADSILIQAGFEKNSCAIVNKEIASKIIVKEESLA